MGTNWGERSATTVSKTTVYCDEELERYQTQPLTDDVQFLFLDGIVQKVREIGMVRKVALCAYGIRQDGGRELLSFRLAESEDLVSWRGFLYSAQGVMCDCQRTIYQPKRIGRLHIIGMYLLATPSWRTQLRPCDGLVP